MIFFLHTYLPSFLIRLIGYWFIRDQIFVQLYFWKSKQKKITKHQKYHPFMHWTIFLCSVNGRIVRAPIMMAKSHKRALYYTVVWIHIHVCTPQNFIFAKKLWGTYATKTFYVYIAKKSIFLCYFILVMMSCFQCNSLPQDALSML